MAGIAGRRNFWAMMDACDGLAVVLEDLAQGGTMIGCARRFGVSRNLLYEWLHMDESRWQAVERVRREQSGEAHAERALERAENVGNLPGEAQAAKLEIDTRLRLAGVYDKRFAPPSAAPGGGVLVLGDLHINALQRAGRPELQRAEVAEIVEAAEADQVGGVSELPALPAGDNER